MKLPLGVCSILLISLLLWGCRDYGIAPDIAAPAPPVTVVAPVSYKSNVLPIFVRWGCEGCHGGTNGLIVTSVASLLKGGIHGPAIVPGNADASILVEKVSATPPFGVRMPQGGPYLSDSTIQVIKNWINSGALDN